MAAFVLLAAAAVGIAGVLLLPSLLHGRGGGPADTQTLQILSASHAVDATLSTLISRLAEDPTNASAREAQTAQLAKMEKRVAGLVATTRKIADNRLRSLLRASLAEQRTLLGQYEAVLGADPAGAPTAIANMQATLARIDSRLRGVAGGPAG